eukprot:scaffold253465_cov31-Tisochrysis_lutea.AAC.1
MAWSARTQNCDGLRMTLEMAPMNNLGGTTRDLVANIGRKPLLDRVAQCVVWRDGQVAETLSRERTRLVRSEPALYRNSLVAMPIGKANRVAHDRLEDRAEEGRRSRG